MHEVNLVTNDLLELPGIIDEFKKDYGDFKSDVKQICKDAESKQVKFTEKMDKKFEENAYLMASQYDKLFKERANSQIQVDKQNALIEKVKIQNDKIS